MDALISFHFIYGDSGRVRSFVMKFEVTPDIRLAKRIRHEDRDFDSRLEELLDDLEIMFAEDWTTGDADLFGWLTNEQQDYGNPVVEVKRVRDFFLVEGFRGGEIVEMTGDEFKARAKHTHTRLELEKALEVLEAGNPQGT